MTLRVTNLKATEGAGTTGSVAARLIVTALSVASTVPTKVTLRVAALTVSAYTAVTPPTVVVTGISASTTTNVRVAPMAVQSAVAFDTVSGTVATVDGTVPDSWIYTLPNTYSFTPTSSLDGTGTFSGTGVTSNGDGTGVFQSNEPPVALTTLGNSFSFTAPAGQQGAQVLIDVQAVVGTFTSPAQRYECDVAPHNSWALSADGKQWVARRDVGLVGAGGPASQVLPYTETFTGADGASWPTPWTFTGNYLESSATIQGNAGRITAAVATYAGGFAGLTGAPAATNTDVVVSVKPTTAGIEQYATVSVNTDGKVNPGNASFPNNGYAMQVAYASNSLTIRRSVGGSLTVLVSGNRTLVATVKYSIRFQHVGTVLRARIWDAALPEPTTWDISFDDSASPYTAAGRPGLAYQAGATVPSPAPAVDFDDFTVSVPLVAGLSGTGALTVVSR